MIILFDSLKSLHNILVTLKIPHFKLFSFYSPKPNIISFYETL